MEHFKYFKKQVLHLHTKSQIQESRYLNRPTLKKNILETMKNQNTITHSNSLLGIPN